MYPILEVFIQQTCISLFLFFFNQLSGEVYGKCRYFEINNPYQYMYIFVTLSLISNNFVFQDHRGINYETFFLLRLNSYVFGFSNC